MMYEKAQMKAVVSGSLFYREPLLVEIRQKSCANNTSEPAEESHILVIRTARHHHVTMTEERTDEVNLGGIAEVLPFVP